MEHQKQEAGSRRRPERVGSSQQDQQQTLAQQIQQDRQTRREQRVQDTIAFSRALATLGLTQQDAADLFGVSRQAVQKWLKLGVPSDQAVRVGDLKVLADLLSRYIKADRIPAVLRRPARSLGGQSLLVLFRTCSGDAVVACRRMFDVAALHA